MPDSTARPRYGPSPLAAVLPFVFLNSLGTGVIAAGLFFLARHAYGFTNAANFGLGLVFGATYIPAALYVGPALRGLIARDPRISSRGVLAAIVVLLAALCFLPAALEPAGLGGGWTMWAIMAVAGPLNGAVWPIIESYVSGGRSGHALRRAIGQFNITWSIALAVAFWLMAPLVAEHPLFVLAAQGVAFLASLVMLRWMKPEPGRHLDASPAAHPPVYRSLLIVFRIELPASFAVISALEPYLPELLARLGLSGAWATPAASTWMVSRVAVFALLERWHGWHGRWGLSLVAGVLMVGGFIAAVGAPIVAGGAAAVAIAVGGLAVFGAGAGAIYAAALYYAMEVGQAEVEAGGIHEALIGAGYSVGPICGLVALGAVPAGEPRGFETAFVVLVVCVVAAAAAGAWVVGVRQLRLSRDLSRGKPEPPGPV